MNKYNWTTDKPNKESLYRWQPIDSIIKEHIIKVFDALGGLYANHYNNGSIDYVINLDGQFAKIPSPDDLKKFEAEIRKDERKKILEQVELVQHTGHPVWFEACQKIMDELIPNVENKQMSESNPDKDRYLCESCGNTWDDPGCCECGGNLVDLNSEN